MPIIGTGGCSMEVGVEAAAVEVGVEDQVAGFLLIRKPVAKAIKERQKVS